MATASGGRAALVTSGISSFSQFRLTQFVDGAPEPPNATTDGLLSLSSEDLRRNQMAQPSGQNSDHTPSSVLSRPVQQDENRSNSSPSGFGTLELVELVSNPIVEGILGSNKDGRVRNPTPAKLKGKTDNKLGNFGVMQMGMGSSPGGKKANGPKDAAAERDAAARRTSENTELIAKAAQHDKYVPPKKRGFEGMDSQLNHGSPFASSNKDPRNQAKRPLAPDETKFEQARLLTLLRSINPITVVDQICKAVAYFGGIPGAPPPEDGIFPESANTRETGALFIGWLAEIFPDLSSPEIPKMQEPQGRKSRMRPDRGGKITPSEAPNPRNGFGYGEAITAPAWGLPRSLSLVNTMGASASPEVGRVGIEEKASETGPSTPITPHKADGTVGTTSTSKRGRGRPKGSRNKGGKDGSHQLEAPGSASDIGGQNQLIQDQVHQSPEVPAQVQPRIENSVQPKPSAYVAPVPEQTKTNQPHSIQYPEHSWQTMSAKNHVEPSSVVAPVDELSPEERAVLEAFRQPPMQQQVSTMSPHAVPAKPAPAGSKRKRAPPKPKAVPVPVPKTVSEIPQTAQQMRTVQPTNNLTSSGLVNDTMQWKAAGTSTTPILPPAKKPRQRKPKAPQVPSAPSLKHSASTSGTPPIPPSTIPDSQASSQSQQSAPVSRPPAEGLEAHYERFAPQPQTNGQNHTPSIIPQNQLRQQQKPSSVPPASQTSQRSPAQQQQNLMQHQKSQQGVSRSDDQKMTQSTSSRTSTGYYNHRPSYSQQYPSHQPSQLYSATHQSSPQMSATPSYRTNSTHSLSQASPQYPQSDPSSTYRTASPHAPSPAFTQPDSTTSTSSFRTHTLAQPSPAYSQPQPQAESSYRTNTNSNSTHQPSTSSYARSNTNNTQPQPTAHHYNHFPDTSYVDLPTLESLGHPTSTSNTIGGVYGSLGLPNSSSRSGGNGNSLYGTSSGLGNTFDAASNDLLRGVGRSSGGGGVYGSGSAALGPAGFEGGGGGGGEQELRERMMKGLGGYGRR
jgi:hypothetical protein